LAALPVARVKASAVTNLQTYRKISPDRETRAGACIPHSLADAAKRSGISRMFIASSLLCRIEHYAICGYCITSIVTTKAGARCATSSLRRLPASTGWRRQRMAPGGGIETGGRIRPT